jgi:hypothetical protein
MRGLNTSALCASCSVVHNLFHMSPRDKTPPSTTTANWKELLGQNPSPTLLPFWPQVTRCVCTEMFVLGVIEVVNLWELPQFASHFWHLPIPCSWQHDPGSIYLPIISHYPRVMTEQDLCQSTPETRRYPTASTAVCTEGRGWPLLLGTILVGVHQLIVWTCKCDRMAWSFTCCCNSMTIAQRRCRGMKA